MKNKIGAACAALLLAVAAQAQLGRADGARQDDRMDRSEDRRDAGDALDAAGIAAVLLRANDAEIKAAKTALEKAQSAEVKSFAKHMSAEHQRNQDELRGLIKRLGIVPREIKTARALEEEARSEAAKLAGKRGERFDEAYMNTQVDDHRDVLEQLDRALKNADRPDEPFTAYLRKTRRHVERHLRQAESLRDGGRRERR